VSTEEGSVWCKTCQRQVLARRPATNHILHFLITFFTCGLWGLVWLALALKTGGWNCPWCGYRC